VTDPEQDLDRFTAGSGGGTGGRVQSVHLGRIRGGAGSQDRPVVSHLVRWSEGRAGVEWITHTTPPHHSWWPAKTEATDALRNHLLARFAIGPAAGE